MNWRWDQGRLDYFSYDHLVLIAKALFDLNGIELRVPNSDPLRAELIRRTGLPFAPSNYRVWRNYSRVFACALLATSVDHKLVVTDLCRKIASSRDSSFTVDDYFSFFLRRFSYPFPAFQNYNIHEQQIFPICAILKMLLARHTTQAEPRISLDEVFDLVVGNQCNGNESLEDYIELRPTGRRPHGDEQRQVRELLIFCSQLNVLKWFSNTLFLDLDARDQESFELLLQLATPIQLPKEQFQAAQLIRLGSITDGESIIVPVHTRESPTDIVFTEGRRIRVTHLRSERSPRLRKIYFDRTRPPYLCDMCDVNLSERYPWTDNFLELHHLLPLSSAIAIDMRGTRLDDVEPLCPNCHKSVHAFYGHFLFSNTREEFLSKDEAREVYISAKNAIFL